MVLFFLFFSPVYKICERKNKILEKPLAFFAFWWYIIFGENWFFTGNIIRK